MFAQNLLYLASGEMNPENLGLVVPIIDVSLHFFRLVQYHISGSHDFFFSINKKMSGSCGYIKELKVDSAFGAVGWKLRFGDQVIRSAASYNERTAFIHKIYQRVMKITGIYIHIDTIYLNAQASFPDNVSIYKPLRE